MSFTAGSLLLSLAIIALVIFFLARPWLASSEKHEAITRLEQLTYRKDALLAQIKQLDFDHEVGVIPEDEHQRLRLKLVTETAAIMQQLDALPQSKQKQTKPAPAIKAKPAKAVKPQPAPQVKAKPAAAPVAAKSDADIDAAIEAAVAKLRQPQNSSLQTPPVNGTILTCPQCNREVKVDDHFCAGCGQPINQPSTP
jgi:hypothetical protein